MTNASWPYEAAEPNGPSTLVIESLPQACSLSTSDLSSRKLDLRRSFIPRIIDIEQVPDGFVYWFDRTEEDMKLVSDFALFESRCCNFLSFGIGLHPEGKRISLRITGPGGGAEFLKEAMKGNVAAKPSACGCSG